METILIKNEDGIYRNWTIEEETDLTYKIFRLGYITCVLKSKCYLEEGKLYSEEVRNDSFKNGNIANASVISFNVE